MQQGFLIFVVSLAVGAMGSMLGIGGGVLLIPLLTGLFGVPIKTAIGASIISVIATSSAAGTVYVGRGLAHTRLSMVLEIATTMGALAGGITAVLISPRLLDFAFAALLVYVAFTLRRISIQEGANSPTGLLDTNYTDPFSGQTITYGVRNLPQGLGASFLAGNISGLLGIGCGIIKVPIMNLVMGVPLRAAIATSNFMIGVTAAASAGIYFIRGDVNPLIVAPVALGVLIGAVLGASILPRTKNPTIRKLFAIVLVLVSVEMMLAAFGI